MTQLRLFLDSLDVAGESGALIPFRLLRGTDCMLIADVEVVRL